MEGYSWKISYGDGSSANGNVWKDTVTVGGVTAQDQAIEAAQAISQQFTKDKNNDGLLGLGFSKINTGTWFPGFDMPAMQCKQCEAKLTVPVKPESQKTFIDTVKDNLDSPVFAVSLKHNAPGSYDFGHIDKSKYTGSLKYIDVDSSEGYWMFTTSGFSVGNGQVQSTPIRGIAGKVHLYRCTPYHGRCINLKFRHRNNPFDAPQRRCRSILQADPRSPAEPHGRRLCRSL